MSGSVHCNFCGVFPSAECTSFCISNCGHVFCKDCRDNGLLAVKCNRCSAAAPKFVTIDRNLNPNLQLMFKKPGILVTEHSEELDPIMKFQTNQRTLRFKGQQAQLKQERDRRVELQNEVTTMRDEMRTLQRQYKERSRSRHSSREDQRSRRGDVSEASHHQTMSSVSSNDMSFSDPFKTPANGLKRFTTSTPKMHRKMEEPRPKKIPENSMMSSRLSHSSTIPSLSSFTMEVDDDEIMDVTPAILRDKSQSRMDTQQLQMQPPLPSMRSKSNNMVVSKIDYDPLLSAPKPPLPKTPAPKKNMQSLSMAERLSGPRPKTPQKTQEGTPFTSRVMPINQPKIACGTPLVNTQLRAHTTITPIRPINGSHLSSSTGAAMKRPDKSSAPAFKTPTLPMKKMNALPRTMPAGMKTGMVNGGNPFASVISQPHH